MCMSPDADVAWSEDEHPIAHEMPKEAVVPEVVPEAVPEVVPEAVPEAVPEVVPEIRRKRRISEITAAAAKQKAQAAGQQHESGEGAQGVLKLPDILTHACACLGTAHCSVSAPAELFAAVCCHRKIGVADDIFT